MCGAEIPPEGCQPRFAYIASMDGAEFATNAKHIKIRICGVAGKRKDKC